jgi:hypothetical protein
MVDKLTFRQNIVGAIHRRKRLVAFSVIIIIFILIALYGANYTSIPANAGNLSNGSVIMDANTVLSLEPGHYTYIKFSLPSDLWNLKGSVTSSTYITIYILNQSEYNNLKNNRVFTPIYSEFADSGAYLNISLASGIYYLVFYNYNNQWGVGVEATSNLVVTRT